MSQPSTFLLDSAGPVNQDLPFSVPIFWTAGRTYTFANGVSGVVVNNALFYKSLDGGITWTKPDVAHARVCNGLAVFFWDGVSNFAVILNFSLAAGVQSPILQRFGLDSELYSGLFGAINPPSLTLSKLGGIYQTADGSLFCFYDKITGGPGHVRAVCSIYKQPTTPTTDPIGSAQFGSDWIGGSDNGFWTAEFDYGTNIAGVFSGWESCIVEPAANRVHAFYTDGANNYFYRIINSDGSLGPVTTFPAGFNLTPSNLNFGRSFFTGYIRAGSLFIPATSKTALAARYFTVLTGTPLGAAVFTQSTTIDSGPNASPLGSDPAQGIGFSIGTIDYVAYFIGDGVNLYNLLKLAKNTGLGWTTQIIYDATQDPNALKNPGNNQWLNTISAGVNNLNQIGYQFAVWHNYPGDANTTIINTLFLGAAGTSTIPLGFPNANLLNNSSFLFPVTLPDPKLCKTREQMQRQFQKGFSLPNLPGYETPPELQTGSPEPSPPEVKFTPLKKGTNV